VNEKPAAETGVWRVAVPSPLRKTFDYLPPEDTAGLAPPVGVRVRVPFGRGTRIGLLVGLASGSEVPWARLRRVGDVLDEEPIADAAYLEFLHWVADYYHHPLGEVVVGTLPAAARRGRSLGDEGVARWRLTPAGLEADEAALARAPRQLVLLHALRASGAGLFPEQLAACVNRWQAPMRGLVRRSWVERVCEPEGWDLETGPRPHRELNPSQRTAAEEIIAAGGRFAAFLLHGITGSGKTEVYLELIEQLATDGKQALVLIPEIGLTPQIVARFRQRLRIPVVVLHSGLGESARLRAWSAARSGQASVVIGTRSAVFTPLLRPGLFIVDEEQDSSYKQQEGLRYSARDLAVVRARMSGTPVVLGSATPSLESVHNVKSGRYSQLLLPHRAQEAAQPSLEIVDLRGRSLRSGLSAPLMAAVEGCVGRGEQAILFINRRGFATSYLCRNCGWVAECDRCDANMVLHRQEHLLLCHHCGSRRAPPEQCPECSASEFRPLGTGTQQVVETLRDCLPGAEIRRVDRDSTRRKGAFESLLESMHAGEIDIVVGTQMVAKGHHFPNVTLVGVLDADGGLFGVDFRAGERMAQLLLQVAGRAGRGDKPGRVVIQTHHPTHPLLRALIASGYGAFARDALEERAEAGLPPYIHMALLRAEAPRLDACEQFLEAARRAGAEHEIHGISLLGPVPAPMARRAGRYRAQLFVESPKRAPLHRFLSRWIAALERLPSARRVRWSIDVDPQEIL
jgi:primosomal protein N' (replication factor Y)